MTKRDPRLSDTVCATCGYVLDAATDVTGKKEAPEDGSISVCLRCGQVGIFMTVGKHLTVRSCTTAECDELIATSSEVRQALAVRQRIIEKGY